MLTVLKLQYSRLIKHSIGALATLSTFLSANKLLLSVMSASNPTPKVAVDSDRPIMVRYCMCHPYDSFLTRVD